MSILEMAYHTKKPGHKTEENVHRSSVRDYMEKVGQMDQSPEMEEKIERHINEYGFLEGYCVDLLKPVRIFRQGYGG